NVTKDTGPPNRIPKRSTELSVMILTFLIDAPVLSEIDNMKPSRGPDPTPAALYNPPPNPMNTIPTPITSKSVHVRVTGGKKSSHKKRSTKKQINTPFIKQQNII